MSYLDKKLAELQETSAKKQEAIAKETDPAKQAKLNSELDLIIEEIQEIEDSMVQAAASATQTSGSTATGATWNPFDGNGFNPLKTIQGQGSEVRNFVKSVSSIQSEKRLEILVLKTEELVGDLLQTPKVLVTYIELNDPFNEPVSMQLTSKQMGYVVGLPMFYQIKNDSGEIKQVNPTRNAAGELLEPAAPNGWSGFRAIPAVLRYGNANQNRTVGLNRSQDRANVIILGALFSGNTVTLEQRFNNPLYSRENDAVIRAKSRQLRQQYNATAPQATSSLQGSGALDNNAFRPNAVNADTSSYL
jgi:hypothetical protein